MWPSHDKDPCNWKEMEPVHFFPEARLDTEAFNAKGRGGIVYVGDGKGGRGHSKTS